VCTVRAMGGSTNRKEYGSNQFVSRGGMEIVLTHCTVASYGVINFVLICMI
jgi:hypothetical protein